MSDLRPNLADVRDYNTDDGEEFWTVGASLALEAVHNEMMSWPEARVLNPDTGEIFEGPLRWLVDRIVEAVRAGHDVRVEPVADVKTL